MTEDQRATGTPNIIYDLASVLFHALEGGASYDTYVQDAEEAGDEELADFFRTVREEDNDRANEARLLLAERTPTTRGTEGVTLGASPVSEPSTDLPGAAPIIEETPSRAVERETATTPRTPEEDLRVTPSTGVEDTSSPRTEPISAPPGTEDVPPRRTEEVERPGEASWLEQERAGREERAEDKGLVDRARDYMRGEGRERDYLSGE